MTHTHGDEPEEIRDVRRPIPRRRVRKADGLREKADVLRDKTALAHSKRFRKVSTRYPHMVALAYDRDLARAAADTDEQVAATVAAWERANSYPVRDWVAVGCEERGEIRWSYRDNPADFSEPVKYRTAKVVYKNTEPTEKYRTIEVVYRQAEQPDGDEN